MQNIKRGGFYFGLSSSRLEGTEEKFRNRESRPEDLQLIAELKDMVSERESLVKKLVVGNCWLSNTWVTEDHTASSLFFSLVLHKTNCFSNTIIEVKFFKSEKINCLTVPGV